MKNAFLLTLPLLLFACKSKPPANGTALTGKLVISAMCNHYVVALETGSIDTAKLASSWKDDAKNTVFNNVFTVASGCSFSQAGLKEGDQFSFEIAEKDSEDCATCMAFYPTPEQKLFIKNIRKINP